MSRKRREFFCEPFANGFHDMKGLCAGMTRAAIKQNNKKKNVHSSPSFQAIFCCGWVFIFSKIASFWSGESVLSLTLSEVEVQRFRENRRVWKAPAQRWVVARWLGSSFHPLTGCAGPPPVTRRQQRCISSGGHVNKSLARKHESKDIPEGAWLARIKCFPCLKSEKIAMKSNKSGLHCYFRPQFVLKPHQLFHHQQEKEWGICHIVLCLMNNTQIPALSMEIGISAVLTSLNMSKKKVIYMQNCTRQCLHPPA